MSVIAKEEYTSSDWTEIFKGGLRTDSRGRTGYFPKEKLDYMVKTFNPKEHKVPLVFGHPQSNEPAYGLLDKVKRVGSSVLAKFKQVPRAVADLVKNGHYPCRSTSLYPDGRIRHVGLLGAVPPAIKGMADMKFFNEEEDAFIYFFEHKNYEDGGNDVGEKEKEIQELKNKLAEFEEKAKAYEEKAKTLEESEKETQAKKTLEEKEKIIETILAENEELKAGARKKEFSEFADSLGTKLKPGHKKYIIDFCEILHEKGSYEFSEGGSQNAVDKFKSLLTDNLTDQYSIGEFATKDKAQEKPSVSSDYAELDNVNEEQLDMDVKVKSYMKQHNISSYAEAYKKVRS